jgi:hypothetical protein
VRGVRLPPGRVEYLLGPALPTYPNPGGADASRQADCLNQASERLAKRYGNAPRNGHKWQRVRPSATAGEALAGCSQAHATRAPSKFVRFADRSTSSRIGLRSKSDDIVKEALSLPHGAGDVDRLRSR